MRAARRNCQAIKTSSSVSCSFPGFWLLLTCTAWGTVCTATPETVELWPSATEDAQLGKQVSCCGFLVKNCLQTDNFSRTVLLRRALVHCHLSENRPWPPGARRRVHRGRRQQQGRRGKLDSVFCPARPVQRGRRSWAFSASGHRNQPFPRGAQSEDGWPASYSAGGNHSCRCA